MSSTRPMATYYLPKVTGLPRDRGSWTIVERLQRALCRGYSAAFRCPGPSEALAIDGMLPGGAPVELGAQLAAENPLVMLLLALPLLVGW